MDTWLHASLIQNDIYMPLSNVGSQGENRSCSECMGLGGVASMLATAVYGKRFWDPLFENTPQLIILRLWVPGRKLMMQFAHYWHLPCCHNMKFCSHVSSGNIVRCHLHLRIYVVKYHVLLQWWVPGCTSTSVHVWWHQPKVLNAPLFLRIMNLCCFTYFVLARPYLYTFVLIHSTVALYSADPDAQICRLVSSSVPTDTSRNNYVVITSKWRRLKAGESPICLVVGGSTASHGSVAGPWQVGNWNQRKVLGAIGG